MKKIMLIIKRIVMGLCMLYTFNILVSKTGLIIPINTYSILLVTILDIPGIILLLILKKFLI